MYLGKIIFRKKVIARKIRTYKPMKFPEKASSRNPPQKAEKKPNFPSGFSIKFIRITANTIRFRVVP
jgi:hypothetical protein